MSKRFIDTELWDKQWFMNLPIKYKLYWIFLFTKCDCIGVWDVNMKLAEVYVGEKLEEGIPELFKNRIDLLCHNKWIIKEYIAFQYGKVTDTCPAHKPVIAKLNNIKIGYEYPIDSLLIGYNIKKCIYIKNKDKEKVKVKDKEGEEKKKEYPLKIEEGQKRCVLLTDLEYEKLKEHFGEEGRWYWISTLNEGILLKGYKYKSHYMAILKWSKREGAPQYTAIKTETKEVLPEEKNTQKSQELEDSMRRRFNVK